MMRWFCTVVTPVPAAVLTVTTKDPVVWLSTQYCWTVAGTMTLMFAVIAPVNLYAT